MENDSFHPKPQTLLDGSKPSNNVGRGQKNFAPDRLRSGSGANSEQRGSVANASELIPAEWVERHAEGIEKALTTAKKQSVESGRTWTLMADRRTQSILADCPDRSGVSEATAERYRMEFARLVKQGVTAYEKATSPQHWNLLRTATRYCLETEIKRLRGESEQALRAKNLPLAQEKTLEAFRLAVVLDEQFLAHGHRTWADKREEMARKGEKPVSRSKRNTKAPKAPFVGVMLADTHHRGAKTANRHVERLAVMAITGCRPCELKKGIEVRLMKRSGWITFSILGGKCDEQRGQARRFMAVPVNCPLSRGLVEAVRDAGGRKVIKMTDADHRSLNRALKAHGLSCYSFRHAFGSELKSSMAKGAMTPAEAAQAMGHASTRSVTYYGRTSEKRSSRRIEVKASREVKKPAVTRSQKEQKRSERKAANDFRFPPRTESPISAPSASGPKWEIPKVPMIPKPPSWSR